MGWIKAIADWIRRLTDPRLPQQEKFLKRYRYSGSILTLLADESSSDLPGLVSLYELTRPESKYCLIILLSNIAQSKERLGRLPEMSDQYQRQFELRANLAIRQQEKSILGSHLLLVGRISKEFDRERWVDGKLVRFKHVDFLAAHVLNLQSEMSVLISGQNGYAYRIVEAIAKKLMRLTPTDLNTWDEFVAVFPWLNWVEYFACKSKHTRLPDKDFIIQPPRSRTASPKRYSQKNEGVSPHSNRRYIL